MKAVLFDLDDTLLKTIEAKWDHHRACALEFYGISLTDEKLREHWGKPLSVLIAELYEFSDTPEAMMVANRSMEHRFPKNVHDDAASTITALLDRGLHVGVVTSTLTNYALDDLHEHGFPVERLAFVHGEDVTGTHKPDPDVFKLALDQLSLHDVGPTDITYVGDSLLDLYAARDAGFSFLGVTTGLVSAEVMRAAGAINVVDRVSDVLLHV